MGREMIRPATYADIPRLIEMGRRFHLAAYADLPVGYDTPAVTQMLLRMIDGDDAAVFVSERGMIGGVLTPFYMDPASKSATELFWWAEDGSGVALRERFEAWARDAGAVVTAMSAFEHMRGPAIRRVLAKQGYRPSESVMMRVN